MHKPIISVHNLTKSYRLYAKPADRLREALFPWKKRHSLFHALNDVSFDVYKGKHLGIVGINGAGKSTLLQILTGVLSPSRGDVQVKGRVAALLELGAGFNPELTGRENVLFLTSIFGNGCLEPKKLLENIMDFAEIGQFIDQPVKVYSSGMFARLAFAMNIATLPEILIIDEALAVGDAFFQQKCLRRMQEYRENGTIIFVSHDTFSVIQLCDHALWLENGSVKEYGIAEEVCKHYLSSNYSKDFDDTDSINQAVSSELIKNDDLPHSSAIAKTCEEEMRKQLEELKAAPVSDFAEKDSFGEGGAEILRCTLENLTSGTELSFTSDELCRMTIYFHCTEDISNLIAGFFLKDRLGNQIYGTNSYRYHKNWDCKTGGIYAAVFEFILPDLFSGEYILTIALAEGTLQTHRQLHWIYDAMKLQFQAKANDGTTITANCKTCCLVRGKNA